MTEQHALSQNLLQFIRQCPDAFHTVETIASRLKEQGYQSLSEGAMWQVQPGKAYFVTRNQSSLIAFRIPTEPIKSIMITASHGDAPCFKIKPSPDICENGYRKLNTEPYGGMIAESWFDRPLSISGRVLAETPTGIRSLLLHINRDLLSIPNLAPHLKSSADKERSINPQTDLLPLLGQAGEKSFWDMIGEELALPPSRILDADLFLHCRQWGSIWGEQEEFISSPRLDDLLCVYAGLEGFLEGNHPEVLPVFAVFDNEEVGSGTKQGAKSTFLSDILSRISDSLGISHSAYCSVLHNSFLLSCDNGHGVHPNRSEKSDPTNRPLLNGGVLLKYNANQKYTTDGVSGAMVRQICNHAGVPVQTYVNRSDIPGGSTLGNLACEKVSVNSADIGVSQLSMHSAWETAGTKDVLSLKKAIHAFYHTAITGHGDGCFDLDMK
ncbi:MAG: M18 family aminopeptidase [Clostridia bacterium]|nr:M18 family aminopeptidase [Clostridia bacterium]